MGPTPEAFRLGGLSGLIATFQLNVCKAFLKADPSLTVTESPKSGLFVVVFFIFLLPALACSVCMETAVQEVELKSSYFIICFVFFIRRQISFVILFTKWIW